MARPAAVNLASPAQTWPAAGAAGFKVAACCGESQLPEVRIPNVARVPHLKARLIDGAEISGKSTLDERNVKPELPVDYSHPVPTKYVYLPAFRAIKCGGGIVSP